MTALPAEPLPGVPEAGATSARPLRPLHYPHSWHLVSDEDDGYGRVRLYECDACDAVRWL